MRMQYAKLNTSPHLNAIQLTNFGKTRDASLYSSRTLFIYAANQHCLTSKIRVSIMVSIPACHVGDRSSILRRGASFFLNFFSLFDHFSAAPNRFASIWTAFCFEVKLFTQKFRLQTFDSKLSSANLQEKENVAYRCSKTKKSRSFRFVQKTSYLNLPKNLIIFIGKKSTVNS